MSETLPQLSPSAQDLLYGLAYAQIERNAFKEALSLFRLLTFQKVDQQNYWIGLGMACQGTKDYKEALRAYTKAANLGADNPHVHLKAAECYIALNLKQEALKALTCADHALRFNPDDALQAQVDLLRTIWR